MIVQATIEDIRQAVREEIQQLTMQDIQARYDNVHVPVETVAQAYKISEMTVYNYIKAGIIPTRPREAKAAYWVPLSFVLTNTIEDIKNWKK